MQVTVHEGEAILAAVAAAAGWRRLTRGRASLPAQQGPAGLVPLVLVVFLLGVAAWKLRPARTAITHAARHVPAPRPVTRVIVQHAASNQWPLSGPWLALVLIAGAGCCVALAVTLLGPLIRRSID